MIVMTTPYRLDDDDDRRRFGRSPLRDDGATGEEIGSTGVVSGLHHFVDRKHRPLVTWLTTADLERPGCGPVLPLGPVDLALQPHQHMIGRVFLEHLPTRRERAHLEPRVGGWVRPPLEPNRKVDEVNTAATGGDLPHPRLPAPGRLAAPHWQPQSPSPRDRTLQNRLPSGDET